MARRSLGPSLRSGQALGGEARWVDDHDPSRLAALRTTPAAPCCDRRTLGFECESQWFSHNQPS
jgi:hypothetical protein